MVDWQNNCPNRFSIRGDLSSSSDEQDIVIQMDRHAEKGRTRNREKEATKTRHQQKEETTASASPRSQPQLIGKGMTAAVAAFDCRGRGSVEYRSCKDYVVLSFEVFWMRNLNNCSNWFLYLVFKIITIWLFDLLKGFQEQEGTGICVVNAMKLIIIS